MLFTPTDCSSAGNRKYKRIQAPLAVARELVSTHLAALGLKVKITHSDECATGTIHSVRLVGLATDHTETSQVFVYHCELMLWSGHYTLQSEKLEF